MSARAVVLVSGGLDSATTLAIARHEGFECHGLSVHYGQRHLSELQAAKRVCSHLGAVDHREVAVGLDALGGSAWTDPNIDVPTRQTDGIPVTYVPARNTVMLSIAMAHAEVIGANAVFIGVNAVDYSGYPDCRPAFIDAFANLSRWATRQGVETGQGLAVHAPLIQLTKADIIRRGVALGVDYAMTVSCYQADAGGAACGVCDSCRIRRDGFAQAGVLDPTLYQSGASG